MAQDPSVTGSKGQTLGMCWVSLQGLEGNGDREPGACGGMWGRRWEGSLEVGDEEGRGGKLKWQFANLKLPDRMHRP